MDIRSQIQHRGTRFAAESQRWGMQRFGWMCLVSLGVHVLFFGGVFWFHSFEFQASRPRVVRVDLVSFVPGPQGGPAAPKTAEAPSPALKEKEAAIDVSKPAPPVSAKPASPEPVPVIKPDVSLKAKPKNLKELTAKRKEEKKKPQQAPEPKPAEKPKPQKRIDPETELSKARADLAKKVEAQNQDKIKQALARMKAAIAGKEQNEGQGAGVGGQGSGDGSKGLSPIEMYKLFIASTIRQNWVFNDVMARMNKNLECRVLIKILKSGEIRDIIYETRSGNLYLDESAKKAIQRSNPLPELPKGLASYDIGLVFSPEGLK